MLNINVTNCPRYNVVVAGGGPAGIAASIAAARQGQKTLLMAGIYERLCSISTNGGAEAAVFGFAAAAAGGRWDI